MNYFRALHNWPTVVTILMITSMGDAGTSKGIQVENQPLIDDSKDGGHPAGVENVAGMEKGSARRDRRDILIIGGGQDYYYEPDAYDCDRPLRGCQEYNGCDRMQCRCRHIPASGLYACASHR